MAKKKKLTTVKAPVTERHYVRNQSDRRGPVTAIIVHSTESQDIPGDDRDLWAIHNWFDNPASQASSHIGIDGDGKSHVWVPAERKAWTAGAANSWSLNIEFIARAAQAGSEWEPAQIDHGAQWVAYWAHRYGIPIQRGNCQNFNGLCVCTKRGVITHFDVTRAGFGSHTDPGANFPMTRFLQLAQRYRRTGWPD